MAGIRYQLEQQPLRDPVPLMRCGHKQAIQVAVGVHICETDDLLLQLGHIGQPIVKPRTPRFQFDRVGGPSRDLFGVIIAAVDRADRVAIQVQQLGRIGIAIRTGIHTGEIELRGSDDVAGLGVHLAARIMNEASPGEILTSNTVKDLVVGSDFRFDDRGLHSLKGFDEEWRLFAVEMA